MFLKRNLVPRDDHEEADFLKIITVFHMTMNLIQM